MSLKSLKLFWWFPYMTCFGKDSFSQPEENLDKTENAHSSEESKSATCI